MSYEKYDPERDGVEPWTAYQSGYERGRHDGYRAMSSDSDRVAVAKACLSYGVNVGEAQAVLRYALRGEPLPNGAALLPPSPEPDCQQ